MQHEIKIKEGKTPKEKRPKKKLSITAKIFISIFSMLIGLPVLCVGLVYACFYDSSHTEILYRQGVNQETIINETVTDALDDTTIEKRINLAITTEQINSLIYSFVGDNEYIKGLYFNPTNSTLQLCLEVNAKNIFKTKVSVDMACALQDVPTKENPDETELAIVFAITNIKVGRINGMQKVLDIIKKFITLPDLTSTLQKTGLHLEVSLDGLYMMYRMNTLYSDINEKIGEKAGSDFFTMVKEILSNRELINVTANGFAVFNVEMNLEKLVVTEETIEIPGYKVPETSFYADDTLDRPEFIRNSLKLFLDKGPENGLVLKDCDVVAKYMMGGNRIMKESEMTIINQYLAKHLFDDLTEHKSEIISGTGLYPYKTPVEKQIKNILVADILPQIASHPSTITTTISTSNMDDMFAASTSLGNLTVFARNMDYFGTEYDYKVNYVVPDRMTSIISGENSKNIFIVTSVNLNGEVVHITLEANQSDGPQSFGKLKYTFDDMYLGDFVVSGSTRSSLMGIVKTALGTEDFGHVIKLDSENETVTFDLSEVFNECGVSETNYNCVITPVSNTATGAGSIQINLTHK